MTDTMRLSAEGKYISKRWWSLIYPDNGEDVDAKEIISDIVNRAGLEVLRSESTGSSS